MEHPENKFSGEGRKPKPDMVFRTYDHPEARDRIPELGDTEHSITLRLEDNRILNVLMGHESWSLFRAFIDQMDIDDGFSKLMKDS